MSQQSSDDFWTTERTRDDFEADEVSDPATSMQIRMHQVWDVGLSDRESRALSPCGSERSDTRRLFCWTSYGRNLRVSLPKPAWLVVGVLRPRTLLSYKAVDLRFPPSVRVHLPYDATSDVGYEDEAFGIRFRLKF
jgi:hypothetical protein